MEWNLCQDIGLRTGISSYGLCELRVFQSFSASFSPFVTVKIKYYNLNDGLVLHKFSFYDVFKKQLYS